MEPLKTFESRDIALVGEGLGIDRQQGTLTRMFAWGALLFVVCGLVSAVRESSAPLGAVSVLGALVVLALFVTSSSIRKHTRVAQEQRLEVESAWAHNQGVRIDGYRAYVASLRPAFDFILEAAGRE